MKKIDFFIIFILLVLAAVGVCFVFPPASGINMVTTALFGALILYVPCFILTASRVRGSKTKRARVFLYGGLLLVLLAVTVWHAFSVNVLSPGIPVVQKETLLYYQQIVILLCSSIGGSSIFHGVRLFSEALEE